MHREKNGLGKLEGHCDLPSTTYFAQYGQSNNYPYVEMN